MDQKNIETFYIWLSIRHAPNYAIDLYRVLLKHIRKKNVSFQDFESDTKLRQAIHRIIFNSNHKQLLPKNFYQENTKKSRDSDSESESESEGLDSKLPPAQDSLYRTVLVFRYFAEFLGLPTQNISTLSKQISTRAKNSVETDFVLMLHERQITTNILNKLTSLLRCEQHR